MRRWLLGMGLVALALGGVGTVQADYEAGQQAWDAGKHSEALHEWRAAANAGDAKAMLALGRLYVQGLGAPQSYVQAHMWFNLAASRGEAEAVTERDALAARMAPEQVAKAQDQAAAWQPRRATSESAEPPPPKAIREAQELLVALGYAPDPPDGQWGERTAQAYQAFVRDANLPVTDTLTPAALKAMRTMARQAGAVPTPEPKAALPPDALHRAAKAGNLKGLEAALAAGADVNARDDRGWTALMYVVDKGYVLLVEPLLTAKADVNLRGPDGATALFMAAAHGHGEIIPKLMKAGADPTIKGPKEKTATDVAQARYGDLRTALKKDEPPAIIALLAGKTWAEGEEGVRTLRERRQPGRIFRNCDQCPEMVVIPAGRFRMGDEGHGVERPVHEVTITEPLAVGVYEVTRREFGSFVEATGYSTENSCSGYNYESDEWEKGLGRHWRDPGFAQTDQHPVVCMSWDDAQAYVAWLSRETGKSYRLLSEAEWEYVARAGTTTQNWWGNDTEHAHANYGRSPRGGKAAGADRWVHTAPVGSFEANAFGLFDTAGNVQEWVEDCGKLNYQGVPADGSAWTGSDCDVRALRGGSWADPPSLMRVAHRFWWGTDRRRNEFGFRVARTLD